MFNSSASSPSDNGVTRRLLRSLKPSTQPSLSLPGIPSTIPESTSANNENRGHFPPAPEFYPLGPPLPPQDDQPAALDLDMVLSPSDTLENPSGVSEPMSNSSKKRPAGTTPTARRPAAKRAKKSTNNVPGTTIEDELQGLGPIPPPDSQRGDNVSSSDDTSPDTSISQDRRPHVRSKKARSAYWKLVYPLGSEKQPEKYSLHDEAILHMKPPTPFVGCRECNQPSEYGSPSVYVQSVLFYPFGSS
jgi:hypothetical protein